jgi:hypothetical protein
MLGALRSGVVVRHPSRVLATVTKGFASIVVDKSQAIEDLIVTKNCAKVSEEMA